MEISMKINERLAVAEYQTKAVRALFRTMKAGRRFRLAINELMGAGFALGKSDKEVLKFLRGEYKTIAKIQASTAAQS